jgi:hypothetical protein
LVVLIYWTLSDVKLDFLLEWAKENGASLHFSAVKKHPFGGYGIFATKDLSVIFWL